VINVMTSSTETFLKGATKRFGDWCVGGRHEYAQTINPPEEALV
jgi:hypothetical protein